MTAAGLPLTAATSFTLGRLGDDFGNTQNTTTTNLFRALVGLKGQLAGTWTWDAYYQCGRTRSDQTVADDRIQEQVAGVPLGRGPALQNPTRRGCSDQPGDGPGRVPLHPNQSGQWLRARRPVRINQYSSAAQAYLYGTAFQHQITALDQAVWRQHRRVVRFLLAQKGIRVNVVNGDGQTPLMIAGQNGDPAIVRLLEEGATTREAHSPSLAHR